MYKISFAEKCVIKCLCFANKDSKYVFILPCKLKCSFMAVVQQEVYFREGKQERLNHLFLVTQLYSA